MKRRHFVEKFAMLSGVASLQPNMLNFGLKNSIKKIPKTIPNDPFSSER